MCFEYSLSNSRSFSLLKNGAIFFVFRLSSLSNDPFAKFGEAEIFVAVVVVVPIVTFCDDDIEDDDEDDDEIEAEAEDEEGDEDEDEDDGDGKVVVERMCGEEGETGESEMKRSRGPGQARTRTP